MTTLLTDKSSKASFFGNAREQVEKAHAQIAATPQLAHGYDAIGFSQGGQFLRSLAQSFPEPRMHTLITLGSQHMGVARLPPCSEGDFLCKASEWALKAGAWTGYAQSHIVPAQYNRCAHLAPPKTMTLSGRTATKRTSLPTCANRAGYERSTTNDGEIGKSVAAKTTSTTTMAKEQITARGTRRSRRTSSASIDSSCSGFRAFVFILARLCDLTEAHSEEATVSPPESAYFTLPNLTTTPITPIAHSRLPLYIDDYIGLRALDERGAVHFAVCKGGALLSQV